MPLTDKWICVLAKPALSDGLAAGEQERLSYRHEVRWRGVSSSSHWTRRVLRLMRHCSEHSSVTTGSEGHVTYLLRRLTGRKAASAS